MVKTREVFTSASVWDSTRTRLDIQKLSLFEKNNYWPRSKGKRH
jgi:hypothetical protein